MSDLKADWVNQTSIEVSFNPPSTLDGIPIRNYTIDIYLQDNTTIVTSIITENTMVIFSGHNICYNYMLSVSALNDVGVGDTAMATLKPGNYSHKALLTIKAMENRKNCLINHACGDLIIHGRQH